MFTFPYRSRTNCRIASATRSPTWSGPAASRFACRARRPTRRTSSRSWRPIGAAGKFPDSPPLLQRRPSDQPVHSDHRGHSAAHLLRALAIVGLLMRLGPRANGAADDGGVAAADAAEAE